ncbi:hypothetical protein QBC35DRAFT_88934 [Podospora australis]|uniref:Secreted protein n=1 Tax=Podospora australis TaxID=1536484 RepID=A0AAN6WXN8_9PEZI|nr:hypothetical protein QBC35DRAFT_88934 [Podospora australis]
MCVQVLCCMCMCMCMCMSVPGVCKSCIRDWTSQHLGVISLISNRRTPVLLRLPKTKTKRNKRAEVGCIVTNLIFRIRRSRIPIFFFFAQKSYLLNGLMDVVLLVCRRTSRLRLGTMSGRKFCETQTMFGECRGRPLSGTRSGRLDPSGTRNAGGGNGSTVPFFRPIFSASCLALAPPRDALKFLLLCNQRQNKNCQNSRSGVSKRCIGKYWHAGRKEVMKNFLGGSSLFFSLYLR